MARQKTDGGEKEVIGEKQDRRYLYSGTPTAGGKRPNRPFARRKISPIGILVLLSLFAMGSVLYIGNTLAVNRLMVEIEELQRNYRNIENMNEFLRAEINRKSAMERITTIASERLRMIFPKEPPLWIELKRKDEETGAVSPVN